MFAVFLTYRYLRISSIISFIKNKIKSSRKSKTKDDVQVRFGDVNNEIRDESDDNSTYFKGYTTIIPINKFKEDRFTDTFKDSSLKTSNKRSRSEIDFTRTNTNRIKTFEEFIIPENLQLDIGLKDTLVHNLSTGKFSLGNILFGAEIKNVTGLKYLGPSRIDNSPIIQIKILREKPLTVKIILNESRFELVKELTNIDNKFVSSRKAPDGHDGWWDNLDVRSRTVNGKYIK